MNITLYLLFALVLQTATVEKPFPAKELTWYTWEEAMVLQKKNPKKLMVDVYTDWCGWCKRMDRETFQNPKVAAYLMEHYYPIKLDAEQRETIVFDGVEFEWRDAGRNGIHMLAYSLLDGQMSYPTIVFLNERTERIMISKGYKKTDRMLKELEFINDERYRDTTLDAFLLE